MESSAKKEIPIKRGDLIEQDKNTIAVVLNEALKQNYTEASVEWVTSHRDLSKPPFNLPAPGISGNTALLDFGDESYFRKPFTETNVYDFKHILKRIGRDKSNSLIFGHGVFQSITYCRLNEIVLNALFPPATNKEIESRNSSGLIEIDAYNGKCKKKMISLSKLECAIQGTYFLSEGLKTDESILKVYAKGPYYDKQPFCGSKRFINTMREALEKKFGSEHFVALGGVYTVNGVNLGHSLIPNDWEPSINLPGRYCHADPQKHEVMITTFNSGKEPHPKIPVFPPMKLNSRQSIHSLSHHSASEKYPIIYRHNQEEEYEGYFCPVKTLYRIDEPSL